MMQILEIEPISRNLTQYLRDGISGVSFLCEALEPNDPATLCIVKTLSVQSRGYPDGRQEAIIQIKTRANSMFASQTLAFQVANYLRAAEHGVTLHAPDGLTGSSDLLVDQLVMITQPIQSGNNGAFFYFTFSVRAIYFAQSSDA